MSDSYDDAINENATTVSTTLTEQMLHLTNRFEEERLKLEERTFQPDGDGSDDAEAGGGETG